MICGGEGTNICAAGGSVDGDFLGGDDRRDTTGRPGTLPLSSLGINGKGCRWLEDGGEMSSLCGETIEGVAECP